LAEEGYSEHYGARGIGRAVYRRIKTPAAEMMLSGKLADGGKISVKVRQGELYIAATPAHKKARESERRA